MIGVGHKNYLPSSTASSSISRSTSSPPSSSASVDFFHGDSHDKAPDINRPGVPRIPPDPRFCDRTIFFVRSHAAMSAAGREATWFSDAGDSTDALDCSLTPWLRRGRSYGPAAPGRERSCFIAGIDAHGHNEISEITATVCCSEQRAAAAPAGGRPAQAGLCFDEMAGST